MVNVNGDLGRRLLAYRIVAQTKSMLYTGHRFCAHWIDAQETLMFILLWHSVRVLRKVAPCSWPHQATADP